MKRSLAFAIITIMLLMVWPIQAYCAESGPFSYELKGNGTAVITEFDSAVHSKTYGIKNDVYVPRQIDGYIVSEIGKDAFRSAYLECVIILPDTITVIGEEAFAFSGFTSIHIPASVKQIGISAFSGMTNMGGFSVDAQNPVYATIDGVLYNKLTKTLVAYPFDGSHNCTIPEGILAIGEDAFIYANVAIELPNTLLEIKKNALAKGERGYIKIPNLVESIGDGAFVDSQITIRREGDSNSGIYLPSRGRTS